MTSSELRVGVSAAVLRGEEVLLIERGKHPYRGFWSLPGGAVQPGERTEQAVRRELLEETGLHLSSLCLADVINAIQRDEGGAVAVHYVIVVYAGRAEPGIPSAGSDAASAGWFDEKGRASLRKTPGLDAVIEKAKQALKANER
jgi:8-oxo-dGTP diphosphatase